MVCLLWVEVNVLGTCSNVFQQVRAFWGCVPGTNFGCGTRNSVFLEQDGTSLEQAWNKRFTPSDLLEHVGTSFEVFHLKAVDEVESLL